MVNFLSEEEAKEKRQKLKESLVLDPTKESYNYSSEGINWVENNEGWEEAKSKSKKMMMDEWEEGFRNIFICHPKDTISGKPQLIYQTKQKIILIRARASEKKDGSIIKIIKFFDEPYDKRYDGIMSFEWGMDFWIYRIVDNNKEYYVLSKEELPTDVCEVRGMNIEMGDLAEVKKNMRLKSMGNIFFVNEVKPLIKIVSLNSLVELTNHLSFEDWCDYLNYHPLNTINKFPKDTNTIRTIQLLSGKMDGWPMHLAVIGPPGTRKSNGWLETTAFKFSDTEVPREGASSTLKSLSPSFKEKPANIGYLAKAVRMGFVDELGKMVEAEMNKHQSAISNVLGEINFLLDHKKRTVGSGNDNDCLVKATAKFLFASNSVKGRDYLAQHIGLIDPTTMSRVVWWVQNEEEQELVMGKEGIYRIPPTPTQDIYTEREERDKDKLSVGGKYKNTENPINLLNNYDFLTIFDTCSSFLSEMDNDLIDSLVQNSVNRSKEPLRSIWRPRAEHHVRLIVDGIVKIRCLFEEHKVDFVANDKDYANASKLIEKIINNWQTKLTIKDYTSGKI